MRKILDGVNYPQKGHEYDFGDYRKFMREHIVSRPTFYFKMSVDLIFVGLGWRTIPRLLRLFSAFKSGTKATPWWDSYNNVKHSDIDKLADGNLKNCLYSVSSIAVLSVLCDLSNTSRIRLFPEVGFIEPIGATTPQLFAKDMDTQDTTRKETPESDTT